MLYSLGDWFIEFFQLYQNSNLFAQLRNDAQYSNGVLICFDREQNNL